MGAYLQIKFKVIFKSLKRFEKGKSNLIYVCHSQKYLKDRILYT